MKLLKIHHVAIICSDYAKSKRISHPEACGLRHLAFEVMDIDQEVAALMSQGVPVEEVRLDALTRKRFTFFSDPDGLPLELYERG
jgi:glyoxylase I family protein